MTKIQARPNGTEKRAPPRPDRSGSVTGQHDSNPRAVMDLPGRSLRIRRVREQVTIIVLLGSIMVTGVFLGFLLMSILIEAWPYLGLHLITDHADFRHPAEAGYRSAIWGSLWLVLTTLAISLPVGIGAAIYLEEYAPPSRLTMILKAGVTNMAGVPSVVFGILGLSLFSRTFGLGPVVLAGALTLSLLVYPYLVTATREALRAVPQGQRDASLALGATRWQTIWHHVLPGAGPGILTGTIIAGSRALGETAPLIVLGAVALMTFDPWGLDSPFVALPIQIYSYIRLPGSEWRGVAAAGIVVLLGSLTLLNLTAVLLRNLLQRRY